MLKSPFEFVKDIESGKHFVLFYENAEYSRSICFAFFKDGLEKDEDVFYFTAKEDEDFFKNEFIEKMYGPNVTYEYNNTSNITFNEKLFHGKNIPSISDIHDDNTVDDINNEIINMVKNNSYNNNNYQDKQSPIVTRNNNNSNSTNYDRVLMVLRCMHKLETRDQVQYNILWEKNFRNIKLRQELPTASLICTYPVENIIKVLKGESKVYSPWMTNLLEIYDGVIYARNNWTGAAFNFV